MPVDTHLLKKVALFGGIAAVGSAWYFTGKIQDNFRRQPFYKKSMELLVGYPAAVDMLGAPIRAKKLNLGNDSPIFCDGTTARLAIPVSGSKQMATLHSWASRENLKESWRVDKLELELETGRWLFYVNPQSNAKNNDVDANLDKSSIRTAQFATEQLDSSSKTN